MANTITINELALMCVEQLRAGNGEKKILIPCDEEGNEYHELSYGFTPIKMYEDVIDFFDAVIIGKPDGVTDDNVDEFILLG